MVNHHQGLAKMHLKQHIIYPADLQAALTSASSDQQSYSIVSPISSRLILSSFISGQQTKLVASPSELVPISASLSASASLAAATAAASPSSSTCTTTATLVATSSQAARQAPRSIAKSASDAADLKACHAKSALHSAAVSSTGAIALTSSTATALATQTATTATTTTTLAAASSTKNAEHLGCKRATRPTGPLAIGGISEDRLQGSKRASSGIGLARFHCNSSSSSTSNNNNNNNNTSNSSGTVGHTVTARLMDLGKRLLSASREGDTDTVKHLVVNSGAPFTSDWLGTTALHLASQNGHFEVVKILLRAGVNKDAKTKLDRTALHLASQGGSLEIVDLLLIYGSDVNARDMLKMTPLHWAAERHHTSVAERLVKYGADLDARSKFQLTPLDIAERYGHFDIVDLLATLRIKRARLERPNVLATPSCKSDPISLSNHQQQRSAKLSQINKPCMESADCSESRDNSDDADYKLILDDSASSARISSFDINAPCIDLVEFEWNTLKFEPDFFLSNDGVRDEEENGETIADEPTVGCLVKIVEELQRENMQLRQKVEQLSTK